MILGVIKSRIGRLIKLTSGAYLKKKTQQIIEDITENGYPWHVIIGRLNMVMSEMRTDVRGIDSDKLVIIGSMIKELEGIYIKATGKGKGRKLMKEGKWKNERGRVEKMKNKKKKYIKVLYMGHGTEKLKKWVRGFSNTINTTTTTQKNKCIKKLWRNNKDV